MSFEWIKQEPLKENEIQVETGPKQEIPLDVEEACSVKVEEWEIPCKLKEEYSSKARSHFEVWIQREVDFDEEKGDNNIDDSDNKTSISNDVKIEIDNAEEDSSSNRCLINQPEFKEEDDGMKDDKNK